MDKDLSQHKEHAERKAEEYKEEAEPWIVRMARFGHLSKGAVYILIGVLAVMTAFGLSGKLTTSSGALYTVAKQPFGSVILAVLAIGLAGYALWQIIMAIFDPEHKGKDAKGWIARISYLIVAGIYIGLCVSAVKIIFRASSGSSSEKYQTLSAKVLAQPFGQFIIGLLGAIIIGVGLFNFYKAYKEKYLNVLKREEMNQKEWRTARYIGKFGISAHGVVFAIMGIFLIRSAVQADPDETKGLDGALAELVKQPYGQVLLTIVALGLVAYGVYLLFEARFRRLDP
ncbi:protein of unknown function [Fictibacillus solisalsi]|uniref:DUF1206 domain-containing protein n=1 Tax=Fictibacillus solisalsi TaxID=459525 RepID=A0A1G9T9U8_9BACL|nr:DUF1206 domain-containing protein [Fictibacillus solisalsi]SDM44421.1 protein of unknown function [Fictibacillus solisalsi]SDN39844.1 protein of unknown function [Fictibacillus solisalsi]